MRQAADRGGTTTELDFLSIRVWKGRRPFLQIAKLGTRRLEVAWDHASAAGGEQGIQHPDLELVKPREFRNNAILTGSPPTIPDPFALSGMGRNMGRAPPGWPAGWVVARWD